MNSRARITATFMMCPVALHTGTANALVCITPHAEYNVSWFLADLKTEMIISTLCAILAAVITAGIYACRRSTKMTGRKLAAVYGGSFFTIQALAYLLPPIVSESGNCGDVRPWVAGLARPLSWLVCGLVAYALFRLAKARRRA